MTSGGSATIRAVAWRGGISRVGSGGIRVNQYRYQGEPKGDFGRKYSFVIPHLMVFGNGADAGGSRWRPPHSVYGATLMVTVFDAVVPTLITSGTAPETPVGTVTAVWYSPTKLGEAIE